MWFEDAHAFTWLAPLTFRNFFSLFSPEREDDGVESLQVDAHRDADAGHAERVQQTEGEHNQVGEAVQSGMKKRNDVRKAFMQVELIKIDEGQTKISL